MKKYYEAYDERYKQIHSMNLEWEANVHSPILDEVIEKLDFGKESKMLELGCGEGRDAFYLMKKGYDVCATDISPEAISFCKQKEPEYADRFMVLNACEDKMVSFSTLEAEMEQSGLVVEEKGITSIEPSFPMVMYAIVKRK